MTLNAGQTTTVGWRLTSDDVGFYDNHEHFRVENGTIEVYAGNTSSESDNKKTFTVVNGEDRRKNQRDHDETSKRPVGPGSAPGPTLIRCAE